MVLAETFLVKGRDPCCFYGSRQFLGESCLSLCFSSGICCLVTVNCRNWSKLCSIMSDVFVLKANGTAQEHSSKEKELSEPATVDV